MSHVKDPSLQLPTVAQSLKMACPPGDAKALLQEAEASLAAMEGYKEALQEYAAAEADHMAARKGMAEAAAVLATAAARLTAARIAATQKRLQLQHPCALAAKASCPDPQQAQQLPGGGLKRKATAPVGDCDPGSRAISFMTVFALQIHEDHQCVLCMTMSLTFSFRKRGRCCAHIC